MPTTPARNGRDLRAYRRKAAQLKRTTSVCWLCGEWIDTDLPSTHPRSWTADHVDPLSTGGDVLGEMRAAHRDCNSSRGNDTPSRTHGGPARKRHMKRQGHWCDPPCRVCPHSYAWR